VADPGERKEALEATVLATGESRKPGSETASSRVSGVSRGAEALAASRGSTRAAAAAPADLSGQRLKHFEVQRLLGRGGMGAVYLGQDTSLDRPVALKVLDPEVGNDPDLLARFVREAQAQARLRHPNVTQIYYIGEDQGIHFFAMEYVEGRSLDVTLKSERIPWTRALEYAIAVARGLREALLEGFIHRDIKPSNLLLDKGGEIKIADFGLVKSLKGDVELTREGAILGSPLYMSPEQGRCETVDHRSDIYSLGCALYHMLTGEPPFSGPSPVTVITKHVTDRARPVRSLVPDVPPAVQRVVDRMMSKEPDHRFATYDELIAALEHARPGRQEHSGFVARITADGIDWAIFAVAAIFLGGWAFLAAGVYFIVLGRLGGQTLGKRLMKLQVTDLDGWPPRWTASGLRFLVAVWGPVLWWLVGLSVWMFGRDRVFHFRLRDLSSHTLILPEVLLALLGLTLLAYLAGLLLAAFHPQRRALHDLVAGTQVIYRAERRRTPRRRP
jgi:uncharacterized RDD family membrane protein YckC